ncbi:hypothetical protein GLT90_02165 [Nanohaloarchaea archaeon H12]|nr:hypothetical protein [Nanohaloarchaea archaeon H12]
MNKTREDTVLYASNNDKGTEVCRLIEKRIPQRHTKHVHMIEYDADNRKARIHWDQGTPRRYKDRANRELVTLKFQVKHSEVTP